MHPMGPGFMGPPPGMQRPPMPDGMMRMPPPQIPPNMPNIDPSKEIWVETVSAEGKIYYYHAKTRQSVWKRPTDDNIQIIKQNEVIGVCYISKYCCC